ncbi:hypothetical protein BDV25DRAFT_140350 [Aspergillus avenaceus]|uniref:Oxidoreductase n=1 Tax=Aspergillus avenaceus TaxID=36643 RepID=A0A5N6TUZ2_ASPAV|nr:hypothetical protein BDV25DRAFT_140350 [Aspergillus avenaceus]
MACKVSGIALITGAASGIGKGTALAFARNGINALSLLDVNLSELESTRDELKVQFPDVEVVIMQVDVTNEMIVDDAIGKTVAQFGRIDIAVHAAGISGIPMSTHEMSVSNYQKVIDINQTGVWLCQKAVIRQMLTQESRGARKGRGVIVNVSSMFGTCASPFTITPYSASKYAVVGMTKTDAKIYAKEGIRMNAICPGYVDTPLTHHAIELGALDPEFEKTPLGRSATVEEVTDSILYLASPMSSFVCATALLVDGGYSA